MEDKSWFKDWFDTKYYHMLYQHRDEQEAVHFIKTLTQFLNLKNHSEILDLACGKGRHSITLNKLGYEVLGADLSENSINSAKLFEKDGLAFIVQDMREIIPNKTFDAVLNLFTSFGYFDDTSDNEKVIHSVFEMLKPNGIFVIDFMNVQRALNQMIANETKIANGISFELKRSFTGTHIIKEIAFEDEGQSYTYQEKVQALKKQDFESLLNNNGFSLIDSFGDYGLYAYDENLSDRLILIARKNG
jgi:2-polyprenyl-3-methyl-5-hydroxy-6-metoxy-1,4-benzoquinol methylase